ncbi:MAG: hypothetical protein INQ03_23085 [Candidatus Heimdallarchaeota archaeon]|nr:hypothetical protein [Candidatus Heimdallarchaeota archaeon]
MNVYFLMLSTRREKIIRLNHTQRIRIHILTEFELDRSKILSMTLLFLFFGLSAVVMQLYLPDILKMSEIEIINLPEPSIQAILIDFWGDISLLSMIIILVTMSTFSAELDVNKNGYIYLSRPISRTTYYVTRYLVRVIGFSLAFALASVLTYGYALLFFDPIDTGQFVLAIMLLMMNIAVVTSLVIAVSTVFNSTISGLLGFVFLFLQMLIGLIEPLKWLSPFTLAGIWKEIIFGLDGSSELGWHVLALSLWIVIPGLAGLIYYNRRDLY